MSKLGYFLGGMAAGAALLALLAWADEEYGLLDGGCSSSSDDDDEDEDAIAECEQEEPEMTALPLCMAEEKHESRAETMDGQDEDFGNDMPAPAF